MVYGSVDVDSLYGTYQSVCHAVQSLELNFFLIPFQETPELKIGTNLIGQVAENESGLIACVRGTVKASDVALKSVAQPEVTGVVRRVTIQEHLVAEVMGIW